MLKDKKTRRLFIISLLFSFILATLYFISKRTFTMDESFSFALANYFEPPIYGWIVYDSNTEIAREVMNGYAVTTHAFNYGGVSWNMAHDVHPPLHPWILHTISSICKGRFSIWFSYLLNLPCFILNCILLMKIVKDETNSNLYMVLINLLYSLNSVFLYHFQLIRMYQLLSTCSLLFLYVALRILKNKSKQYINYIYLFVITILGGLTHYYFYIALGSLSLVLTIYLLINKRYKDLICSFISCVSAFLLNIFVFFDGTFEQFGFSHGASTLDKMEHFSLNLEFMKSYIEQSYGGSIVFYLMLVALFASIIMLIRKHKEYMIVVLLLISYFLYYLFVSNLATYAIERYMMGMEVIGLLALFLGLCYLLKDKRIITIIACGLILLKLDFSWVSRLGTTRSWDIAKEHQWDKALVISSTSNNYDSYINSFLWMDLRWYEATYTSDVEGSLSNELMSEEFVLYIDKTLDENEVLEKVRKELISGQDYKVAEKVDVDINNYVMYILHG